MVRKNKKLLTLITAVDWSGSKEEPKNIYTIVSVSEKNYGKLRDLLGRKIDIKHWKKLRKREKSIYEWKILKRWEDEILPLLERSNFYFDFKDLIFGENEFKDKVIKESHTKIEKKWKVISLLADNLANIVRRIWSSEKNLSKRYDNLRKLIK